MIYINPVLRLNFKVIKLALSLGNYKNNFLVPLNLAFSEACKNFIGFIDKFEETNQELKDSVFYRLINRKFVTTHYYYGEPFIALTQKAINEFSTKPFEEGGYTPSEKKLIVTLQKSLPEIIKL